MLYQQAFPNQVFQILFTSSESVLRPYLWCLNELLSPFIPIDPELLQPVKLWLRRFIVPLYLIILIVLAAPAAVAFILRCVLHLFRRPYVLSVKFKHHNGSVQNFCNGIVKVDNRNVNANSMIQNLSQKTVPKIYKVASSNLCLLPECLARCNNLGNVDGRSKSIAERIIADQLIYRNKNVRHFSKMESSENTCTNNIQKNDQNSSFGIATRFQKLDFLCLQECWERDYCKNLMTELHKEFPWILYDIGKTNLFINYFGLNSGLMFASRYRILDVNFKHYKHSCKQCLFSSKGLLMVKVLLHQTDTQRYVGYIFNSHLQAYQGNSLIIDKQLDDILQWTGEFREETIEEHDVVSFDVLCGDFNFDNMSPGEKLFREHAIFSAYKDECRQSPGRDKDWTIGTEMKQRFMWEKEVVTPEGLRDMLRDPYLRQRYIVDATVKKATLMELCFAQPILDEDGNYKYFPEGGRRRIDYILYRQTDPLDVKSYHFVTRLATLTDHIPVCMSFTCAQTR